MPNPHTRDLARRTPETALERSEDWAALSDGERKRRAGEAVRDNDREALWTLTEAHLLTFGRRGLRVSDNTLDSYRRGLGQLLDWTEAHGVKLHHLTRQDVLRYTRHLEGKGRSPATVNARLSGARQVHAGIRWAGLADQDPFEKISVSDSTPAHEKRQPYSPEELDALVDEAGPRELALVLLAADSGLRASEIAGLDWSDVDLAAGKLVVISGKGRKKRTVAMTARLAGALGELGPEAAGAVFGITRQRIDSLVRSLCRRAGVEPKGIHALRHSCGTRLYGATKDLLVTARHLGHATTRPTEIYAHIADEDYREAVETLGEATKAAA